MSLLNKVVGDKEEVVVKKNTVTSGSFWGSTARVDTCATHTEVYDTWEL